MTPPAGIPPRRVGRGTIPARLLIPSPIGYESIARLGCLRHYVPYIAGERGNRNVVFRYLVRVGLMNRIHCMGAIRPHTPKRD